MKFQPELPQKGTLEKVLASLPVSNERSKVETFLPKQFITRTKSISVRKTVNNIENQAPVVAMPTEFNFGKVKTVFETTAKQTPAAKEWANKTMTPSRKAAVSAKRVTRSFSRVGASKVKSEPPSIEKSIAKDMPDSTVTVAPLSKIAITTIESEHFKVEPPKTPVKVTPIQEESPAVRRSPRLDKGMTSTAMKILKSQVVSSSPLRQAFTIDASETSPIRPKQSNQSPIIHDRKGETSLAALDHQGDHTSSADETSLEQSKKRKRHSDQGDEEFNPFAASIQEVKRVKHFNHDQHVHDQYHSWLDRTLIKFSKIFYPVG